jgi:hypothetical protein
LKILRTLRRKKSARPSRMLGIRSSNKMVLKCFSCLPSLLYFFSIFDPMEAGRCFLWPMRQLFVPFSELNFYRFSKRRDPFQLSFSGNKGGGCGQGVSRRLAGTQHLPASFSPIFRNLQLNMQSEGGQECFYLDIFNKVLYKEPISTGGCYEIINQESVWSPGDF